MKKALIFDMDGVVVKNDYFHCKSWQIFAEKYGKSVSYNEVKSWFGTTNKVILANLFGEELSSEETERYSIEKETIYRNIYSNEITPMKGLRKFLSEPEINEWKIGLATSAPPENVSFVLDKTGFTSIFQTITDDTEIENGKPHPEIFLKTAAKLNVDPPTCIVFEDSHHGIQAGLNAGMKVVGVATTHARDELKNTHLIINNFSDISLSDLIKLID